VTNLRTAVNEGISHVSEGEFVPVSVGPITIWPPVILAPMAGVTDVPFRTLCRSFAQKGLDQTSAGSTKIIPGLFVNQMITARAFVEKHEKTMKLAKFGNDERPRSIQLYGTDPVFIGKAVEQLVDEEQIEHIDLNFGCPVPKVTRHGGGGALPFRRPLFRKVVSAAISAARGQVPITIKFRMGIDDSHLTFLDTGKIAEDEGASGLTLHARTVEQLYSGHAYWKAIAQLKEHVTSIPIFGNGDIWEAFDAIRMLRETNADGVVIGRGCLGRPWLFQQLAEVFNGQEPSQIPLLGEVAAVLQKHGKLVVEWHGTENALRGFRKHAAWYFTGFPVGSEVRREIQQISSLQDLTSALRHLDPRVALPIDAYRIPRSHGGGPKKVSLPAGWLDAPNLDLEISAEAEQLVSGG
jgi:nifR3 family TIM-barrel protein